MADNVIISQKVSTLFTKEEERKKKVYVRWNSTYVMFMFDWNAVFVRQDYISFVISLWLVEQIMDCITTYFFNYYKWQSLEDVY